MCIYFLWLYYPYKSQLLLCRILSEKLFLMCLPLPFRACRYQSAGVATAKHRTLGNLNNSFLLTFFRLWVLEVQDQGASDSLPDEGLRPGLWGPPSH